MIKSGCRIQSCHRTETIRNDGHDYSSKNQEDSNKTELTFARSKNLHPLDCGSPLHNLTLSATRGKMDSLPGLEVPAKPNAKASFLDTSNTKTDRRKPQQTSPEHSNLTHYRIRPQRNEPTKRIRAHRGITKPDQA